MTDGGKVIRPSFSEPGSSPFAPLRALARSGQQEPAEGVDALSSALGDFAAPATVHLQILDKDGVRNWTVRSGPDAAEEAVPDNPDVRLVMRRETWMRIADGSLAPFQALFDGKVAVGGDTEIARRLVEHLSDPSVPFVAPCLG